MITRQIYGYMDFAIHGPIRDEADWMKGREEHDIGELDMSAASKTGAKMALVIDFTARSVALRYELPESEVKDVAPMHQPVVDWRAVNPPPEGDGDFHKAWREQYDKAQAAKAAEPAPMLVDVADAKAQAAQAVPASAPAPAAKAKDLITP